MSTDDPTYAVMLELLKQAETAHGVYETEELGGEFDENWPQWYAEHMTRALADRGYKLVKS